MVPRLGSRWRWFLGIKKAETAFAYQAGGECFQGPVSSHFYHDIGGTPVHLCVRLDGSTVYYIWPGGST